MGNTKRYIGHAVILFIYYFVFVSVSFFVAPYLIERGMPIETVGFLNSIGLFMLIISLLAMGFVADLRISNKKIISGNLIISSVIFLAIIKVEDFFILSILYVLMWATFMVATSLLDGLILKDIPHDKYPVIRSFGSIGAAVSYFLNSTILGAYNFDSIMYLNIVFLILIVVLLLFVHEHPFETKISFSEGVKAVSSNKKVILIMVVTFLTYGVLAADDAYTYTFTTEIANISPATLGIVGFVSIGIEAIIMFFYLPNKFYKYNKVFLSLITMIIMFVFFTKAHFYEVKFLINFGNVILGIFTGLYIPIAINIINKNTDGSIKNSVLSVYQIAIKLGGAILGFLTASYVANTSNLPGIYNLHFVIALIGLVLIIVFYDKEGDDSIV